MNLDQRGALSTRDAATYLGLSERYLANLRCPGAKIDGPPFRRIGRRVVYLVDDLDAWLAAYRPHYRNQSEERHLAAVGDE